MVAVTGVADRRIALREFAAVRLQSEDVKGVKDGLVEEVVGTQRWVCRPPPVYTPYSGGRSWPPQTSARLHNRRGRC